MAEDREKMAPGNASVDSGAAGAQSGDTGGVARDAGGVSRPEPMDRQVESRQTSSQTAGTPGGVGVDPENLVRTVPVAPTNNPSPARSGTPSTSSGAGFSPETANPLPMASAAGSTSRPDTPGSTSPPSDGAPSGDVKDQIKDQAQQAVQQAQQAAGRVMDQARDQVFSQLHSQKDQLAGGIGSVAQALHQAGEHLDQQGQGPVARYAHSAAGQLEDVSSFLKDRDLGDLAWEVEEFARSRPALFLGGAFVLGLLAARFLKSSADQAPAKSEDVDVSPYLNPPGTNSGSYSARYANRRFNRSSSRPLIEGPLNRLPQSQFSEAAKDGAAETRI